MKKELNLNGANKQFLDWEDSLKLINDKQSKNILEFGCGFGTQILCNNFNHVYSFEVHGVKTWFDKTSELMSNWDNWTGVFYTANELNLTEAVNHIYKFPKERNKEAFDVPNGFYDKLNQFVDLSTIDVAFVDHSLNMRAETVNYLMDKEIPYIFAHDTNYGNDIYGWYLVEHNNKYEKIKYNSPQGVTYWIKQ